jgi:hypothetical protein
MHRREGNALPPIEFVDHEACGIDSGWAVQSEAGPEPAEQ